MTDSPSELSLSADLQDRITKARAALGRPFEPRKIWSRRRRKASKALQTLRKTTPAPIGAYMAATDRLTKNTRKIRRDLRRRKRGLWRRVIFAAVFALLWRLRWVFLAIVILAALAVVGKFALDYINTRAAVEVDAAPQETAPAPEPNPGPYTGPTASP
jgi:hypothetical protein